MAQAKQTPQAFFYRSFANQNSAGGSCLPKSNLKNLSILERRFPFKQCRLQRRPRKATMTDNICTHIDAITTVKHPQHRACEECVKIGAQWVHLRTCQTCGATLCCDSSPNRHASQHAQASAHPVIASAEPGEHWLFCYADDTFAEY